jgi:hypothetical protein
LKGDLSVVDHLGIYSLPVLDKNQCINVSSI